jgi:hypothetical protein
MTEKVKEQILAIRDTTETNMFAIPPVFNAWPTTVASMHWSSFWRSTKRNTLTSF